MYQVPLLDLMVEESDKLSGGEGAPERWEVVYRAALQEVLQCGASTAQTKGDTEEILGHVFTIPDGRDRLLAAHPQFDLLIGIGHWLWIMAGRQDFESIRYYNRGADKFSADKFKMHGAYGPRLFGIGVFDQVNRQIELIRARGDSRRAVATVFSPEFDSFRKSVDGAEDEIPCTVALQFRPRDGKLHTVTMMRSQNAFGLLPLDVFVFTLIQEYVAREVHREVGTYCHFSASFHYYKRNHRALITYTSESPEPMPFMPPMPIGGQQKYLTDVLKMEEAIRNHAIRLSNRQGTFTAKKYLEAANQLPEFWQLIIHGLVAMAAVKVKDAALVDKLLTIAHPALQPTLRLQRQKLGNTTSLGQFDFKITSASPSSARDSTE